jgi:hypothetical protein
MFSYIKGEMRDIEREKNQKEEIKIEIRSSQFQMVITFDRQHRLRHAMRSRKAFSRYDHFRG